VLSFSLLSVQQINYLLKACFHARDNNTVTIVVVKRAARSKLEDIRFHDVLKAQRARRLSSNADAEACVETRLYFMTLKELATKQWSKIMGGIRVT